jgi:hypothetical protein
MKVGVDKRNLVSLPFTLLDKFFIEACSPTDILSNGVNPLPPGEGRLFR